MDQNQKKVDEKAIVFANSDKVAGAVELLKACRTRLTTVIANDEFHTLVNALTLEIESNLISRLLVAVDNIRTGANLNEPQ